MTNQPMSSASAPDWSQIPAPQDDGGADHLPGRALPSLALPGTDGEAYDLSELSGRTVLYVYPMTGRPDRALPDGWDEIPGARGCTPQSCAFRDHAADLRGLGVGHLFGLSTQDSAYQAEAAARLHLPFPLLSDAGLAFADALNLPRFTCEGQVLLNRMAMVIDAGRIARVFYPVFPPDRNARDVLDWLAAQG